MKSTVLPMPLRGIIPPLATPLLGQDRLDTAGLERLIEHVLAGGVHGLFILGSTGEGPSLSRRVRCELIELTCDLTGGRVPVLVGITDSSLVDSVAMAEHAADCGAAAVVHAGPYYFPLAQPELAAYAETLAAALPLPLFLYNMPSHTKVSFDPDTVRRLLQVPNIAGIKDSSGQMLSFKKILQVASSRPDFSVLIGPEELLGEAVLMGAHGGVTGGANLDPALYVSLYESALAGDLERTRTLSARVLRISNSIYALGMFWSSYLQGLKGALACMGICDDLPAAPFHRLSSAQRDLLDQSVRELGLVRGSAVSA
jgi:dihydrodipicolinate synthase/N-acetylneuraminate lyase